VQLPLLPLASIVHLISLYWVLVRINQLSLNGAIENKKAEVIFLFSSLRILQARERWSWWKQSAGQGSQVSGSTVYV
jgi:hypothetical protein